MTIRTKVYGPTAAKQSVWGTAIGIMQLGAMIGAGISPFCMRRTSRKYEINDIDSFYSSLTMLLCSLILQYKSTILPSFSFAESLRESSLAATCLWSPFTSMNFVPNKLLAFSECSLNFLLSWRKWPTMPSEYYSLSLKFLLSRSSDSWRPMIPS